MMARKTKTMSMQDVAWRWSVSLSTLKRIPIAELPYMKIRGQRRYHLASVIRYEILHAPTPGAALAWKDATQGELV